MSENQAAASVENSISRERKMTEKSLQYRVHNSQRNFVSAISQWRRHAKEIVTLLTDSSGIGAIRLQRDNLSSSDDAINEVFGKLETLLSTPSAKSEEVDIDINDINERFENQQSEHLQLMTRISDRITELNGLNERSSIIGSRSRSSRLSRNSSTSTSKKSVLAVEAAALETKLKFMDATEDKRVQLEKSKAELEKLEVVKDLAISRAKLDALTEFSEFQSCPSESALPNEKNDHYVEEYVQSLPLNPTADEFAPACANFGLKQVAIDNEGEFGLDVSNFVKRDFYVDDRLKSVRTIETATDMIKQSKNMLAKGGLRLHKFLSNSKEVLSHIPLQDRAKALDGVDLLMDELPTERTLGVKWCVESDCFLFNFELGKRQWTRRGILSVFCCIYDPLGLLSPLILTGKQILQLACKDQVDWDSELSPQLLNRWECWCNDLERIPSVQIKRCLKPDDFGEITCAELHHFSDASTIGYGQCSYIRLVNMNNKVHCSLVMAKSRVTPLKPVTIPRLELSAALVSVKISCLLRRELQYENLTEHFWSDSNVALGYIGNDARRFHIFVGNRVQQIREHSDPSQWKYASTKDNPADIASRGASVTELIENQKWFCGPDFLWESTVRTDDDQKPAVSPDDPEVRKIQTFDTKTDTVSTTASILERLEYFSDWTSAKRAIALCLKLKTTLRKIPVKDNSGSQVELQRSAEMEIIRHVQASAFAEVIHALCSMNNTQDRNYIRQRKALLKRTSSIYRLDLFLDSSGILRVGGRLCRSTIDEHDRHPIILPQKSHITSLIIAHCHNSEGHQGRGITTNAIREHGFWILGCSSAVSTLLRNCVTCRKLRGQNETKKMADLPTDRTQTFPPFIYSGVDFFGPWLIREGRKQLKRYGVLFTCMSSRAIHLETANSLDTSSFINAFRRFVGIRGHVRQLRCDRGTNFIGAERELREAIQEIDQDKINSYLTKQGCDYMYTKFEMNVPSASHMGGVWERQIRSVRCVLASLMYNVGPQLDDESLRTFMYEAAAIVNGRPLTTNNLNDPISLEPLTPNHLLTMKSKVILPPPGEFLKEDIYSRKKWRRVKYALNEFWTRWRKEYLQNLQIRNKWNLPKQNLVVDDIVLVADSNLPRNKWLLGRVIRAEPDADELVRKVSVTIGSSMNLDKRGKRVSELSVLERPIHKLVFLCRFPNEEPSK